MEQHIGLRIRTLREQAGLTQEELAEKMDVSRQAVSKWEANLSRPSSDNLIRLSHLLGVELWELIGNQKEECPPVRREELTREAQPLPTEDAQQKARIPDPDAQPPRQRKNRGWLLLLALIAAVAVIGPSLAAILFMTYTNEPSSDVSIQPDPISLNLGSEIV